MCEIPDLLRFLADQIEEYQRREAKKRPQIDISVFWDEVEKANMQSDLRSEILNILRKNPHLLTWLVYDPDINREFGSIIRDDIKNSVANAIYESGFPH